MKLAALFSAVLSTFALTALAQDAAPTTVTVMESETYGPYLADAEGNSLYLFIDEEAEAGAERMTEGVRPNAAPCSGGCLEAWPPAHRRGRSR